jgi:hypothetical protein
VNSPDPIGDNKTKTKTTFELLFEHTAAKDDSAYFTVPAAIHFRQNVCGGEQRIYEYLEKLALEGGDIIAAKLGTEVLQETDLRPGETSPLRRCAMSCIRLPLAYYDTNTNTNMSNSSNNKKKKNNNDNNNPKKEPPYYRDHYPPLSPTELSTAISFMHSTLMDRYNTAVPLITYSGYIWTRVCAQIYLQRSDFEWLGEVLEGLCERVGRRDFSREEEEEEEEEEERMKGKL